MVLVAVDGTRTAPDDEAHKITVAKVKSQAVTIAQQYVCQIHSRRNIKLRALEKGHIEAIQVKEGQTVKEGDVLFQLSSLLSRARVRAQEALHDQDRPRFQLIPPARPPFDFRPLPPNREPFEVIPLTKRTKEDSDDEFTSVTAPFDGVVGRVPQKKGDLIAEGDVLTTLSDNSVMWVYFNVPEARYLELWKAVLGKRHGGFENRARLGRRSQVRSAWQDRCDRGRPG